MDSRVVAIVVGVVLAAHSGFSAAQECLEPVGSWRYGVSNDVVAEGNRGVLANGAVLQVLDLAAPAVPAVAGEIVLPGEILAVALSGAMAAAITHDHLHVVDIGGVSPTQLGVLSGVGSPHTLAVAGNFVYAINYESLSIFDVSVPSAPTSQGGLLWAVGYPSDVRVVANYAFVVDSGFGLRVVDVADPTVPVEVGGLDLGATASPRRLDIVDELAYAVGSDSAEYSRRLWVINLSDPANPVLVSNTGGIAGNQDIVVHNDTAFVAGAWDLTSYNVTDPQTPVFLGQVWAPYIPVDGQHRLAGVDGFVLMVAELFGLGIYDVGDPAAPVLAAEVAAPGRIESAAYADDTLYIAAADRGFRALDISSPGLPVELGITMIPQQPQVWGVAAAGSTAWTAAPYASAGFVELDVSDPAAPVALGNAPGAVGNRLVVSGGYAYVVDQWAGGIHVVDLSSPGLPTLVGSLDLPPGEWEWPVVVNDHLVVRNNDNDPWVVIFDVGDPTAPVQVAEIDVWANIAGLGAIGSWLLVPDFLTGPRPAIRIFDMSDPSTPAEIQPYDPVGGAVEAVGVAGPVAYLAVMDAPSIQEGAIEVVDFSDPTAPVFMGSRPRSGRVKRFAPGSGELFVFDRNTGFDTFTLCRALLLFSDGFESGDASAWSGVVP
jgi:hypothetical protein